MSLADLARYDMSHVSSLAALCELLAERREDEPPVALLAGGTDLMVQIAQGPLTPGPLPLVVDVSRLDELRAIRFDGTTLSIGAAVSYLELQRHPVVCERTPLIARMTYDIGGPTIQARGTLGGNIATASPAADGVAAVAAFDPDIVVASVRGERRIAMSALQTGYKQSSRARDEVVVAIELKPPPLGTPWVWRKVGTRLAQAISKVALAAVAQVDAGRVTQFGAAMASVAPVTALMQNTRALITGARLDALDATALDAAVDADTSPIDDVRSTRRYRQHVARAIVREFVRELGAAG
jgi:CO/xanthine dehydrogenase FAD-binding subunit